MSNSAVLRFEEPSAHEVQVAALRFAARRLRAKGYLGAVYELEREALSMVPAPLAEFPDHEDTVVCEVGP